MKKIDKDRAEHFKKELKRKKKELPDTKEIKTSLGDPDCGYFHKGEKEKCFAYNVNVACDRHRYILGMSMNAGNVHDSTASICHNVQKDGKEIIVPKKRTSTRKKGCTRNGNMCIIQSMIFSHAH